MAPAGRDQVAASRVYAGIGIKCRAAAQEWSPALRRGHPRVGVVAGLRVEVT
jgi:hypothetical protein